MIKQCVFMFSGQGSQYYHMGRELFIKNSIFRKWMKKQDDIVHEIIGESVLDKLYDNEKRRHEVFNRILHTHPTIFMVEYAMAQIFIESGVEPDYVLGTSLGEFVSAAIAGVMCIEELLELILKQAEFFEDYCQSGGMIAILHDFKLFYETPINL